MPLFSHLQVLPCVNVVGLTQFNIREFLEILSRSFSKSKTESCSKMDGFTGIYYKNYGTKKSGTHWRMIVVH